MNGGSSELANDGIRLTIWNDHPRRVVEDLTSHLEGMGLPDEGIRYVVQAFASPPARRVGTHRVRNLISDVPLPEFDVTLQAESATGEYAFLLAHSRDTSIVAILDQPTTVYFDITTIAGVRTPTKYTGDYLIVYQDRVVVYEVLPEKELRSLIASRRDDWMEDSEQRPHFRPAEKYFEPLGILHSVHVGETISPIEAENLRTLRAVRAYPDCGRLCAERDAVMRLMSKEDARRMSEVKSELSLKDYTACLQLVDQELLYVDLTACVLSDPESVWISTQPHLPRQLSQSRKRLLDALGIEQTLDVERACSPRHESEFLVRYAYCNGAAPSPSIQRSGRSIRRYRKLLKAANGDPQALIPHWERAGNRSRRKRDEHYEILHCIIREARSNPNGCTPAGAYIRYESRLRRELGDAERPFSKAAFYRQFNFLPGKSEDALGSGGRRAEIAASPWLDPLGRSLVPSRPFEIAHVDHWNVDIHVLLDTPKGRLPFRPWLTAMVDAFTGEILAIWLSFRDPSRVPCAMVIRDAVRRHRRLPELLIVDGGKEFDSVHFSAMLASLRVTRTNRSPGDPKFGKEVERLFGHFKERFARGKPGFTDDLLSARKTSARLAPGKRAEMTLSELAIALERYVFTSYNQAPAPGELTPRARHRDAILAEFPFSGVAVEWDIRFLILTAIEAPSASYTLAPPRGIRVLDRWYTSSALASYSGRKRHVHVRIDPFDDSVIYVCLEDTWYACFSCEASRSLNGSEFAALERTSRRHEMRSLLQSVMNAAAREAYELQESLDASRKLSTEAYSTSAKRADPVKHPVKPTLAHPCDFDQLEDIPLDEMPS